MTTAMATTTSALGTTQADISIEFGPNSSNDTADSNNNNNQNSDTEEALRPGDRLSSSVASSSRQSQFLAASRQEEDHHHEENELEDDDAANPMTPGSSAPMSSRSAMEILAVVLQEEQQQQPHSNSLLGGNNNNNGDSRLDVVHETQATQQILARLKQEQHRLLAARQEQEQPDSTIAAAAAGPLASTSGPPTTNNGSRMDSMMQMAMALVLQEEETTGNSNQQVGPIDHVQEAQAAQNLLAALRVEQRTLLPADDPSHAQAALRHRQFLQHARDENIMEETPAAVALAAAAAASNSSVPSVARHGSNMDSMMQVAMALVLQEDDQNASPAPAGPIDHVQEAQAAQSLLAALKQEQRTLLHNVVHEEEEEEDGKPPARRDSHHQQRHQEQQHHPGASRVREQDLGGILAHKRRQDEMSHHHHHHVAPTPTQQTLHTVGAVPASTEDDRSIFAHKRLQDDLGSSPHHHHGHHNDQTLHTVGAVPASTEDDRSIFAHKRLQDDMGSSSHHRHHSPDSDPRVSSPPHQGHHHNDQTLHTVGAVPASTEDDRSIFAHKRLEDHSSMSLSPSNHGPPKEEDLHAPGAVSATAQEDVGLLRHKRLDVATFDPIPAPLPPFSMRATTAPAHHLVPVLKPPTIERRSWSAETPSQPPRVFSQSTPAVNAPRGATATVHSQQQRGRAARPGADNKPTRASVAHADHIADPHHAKEPPSTTVSTVDTDQGTEIVPGAHSAFETGGAFAHKRWSYAQAALPDTQQQPLDHEAPIQELPEERFEQDMEDDEPEAGQQEQPRNRGMDLMREDNFLQEDQLIDTLDCEEPPLVGPGASNEAISGAISGANNDGENQGQHNSSTLDFTLMVKGNQYKRALTERQRRLVAKGTVCLGLCLCVIVLAVVLGVLVFGNEQLSDENFLTSAAPSEVPSFAPSSINPNIERFRDELIQVIPSQVIASSPEAFELALRWYAREDPPILSGDQADITSIPEWEQPYFLQRFVLIWLWFHTTKNGTQPWKSCNPPEPGETDECVLTFATPSATRTGVIFETIPEQIRYLSRRRECEWVHIECSATGDVTGLRFEGNGMTGSFPIFLSQLPRLTSLVFAWNELSGSVPSQIEEMEQLTRLNIVGTTLVGSLPEELYNLTNLTELVLESNGLLTGTISSNIGKLSSAVRLEFVSNQNMRGTLPTEIGLLSSQLLFLACHQQRLRSTIPSEVGKLRGLSHLSLTENAFTGAIPETLSNLSNLILFSLRQNVLRGTIPNLNLPVASQFRVEENRLVGSIPESLFANQGHMRDFQAFDNLLSGPLSESIGNFTNLEILRINSNELTGPIPQALSTLTNLKDLAISRNRFEGTFPEQFCTLSRTGVLMLGVACAFDEDFGEESVPACSCCVC